MAKMTHTQRVCMPTVYDNMERSGKRRNTREVFRQNPYRNTVAEVKNSGKKI